MTAKEIAAILDGSDYRENMDAKIKSVEQQAKKAGLVIAYGESDDLLELRGFIHDEFSSITEVELMWAFNRVLVDDDYREIFEKIDKLGIEVGIKKDSAPPAFLKSEWEPEGVDTSWLITPFVPHETFKVMEDGHVYCIGAVFAWADVMKQADAAEG